MLDSTNIHVSPPMFTGERIVWSGRPQRQFILRPIDAFLVPFSLLWIGFVIFWNVGVWRSGALLSFLLFGSIFLLIGLYFTVGRFVVDAIRLNGFGYFVTNQRIIISRVSAGSVDSADIKRLSKLSLRQNADGSGTLIFGEESFFGSMNGLGIWQATSSSPMRFLAINDAATVYQLIQSQATSD